MTNLITKINSILNLLNSNMKICIIVFSLMLLFSIIICYIDFIKLKSILKIIKSTGLNQEYTNKKLKIIKKLVNFDKTLIELILFLIITIIMGNVIYFGYCLIISSLTDICLYFYLRKKQLIKK